MKSTYTVLGVVLLVVMAGTGLVAASSGMGLSAATAAQAGNGIGVGDGTGPIHATDADRPMDGSNSPWVVGDDRLDRFQERFDLTDDQVAEIRAEVQSLIDDGATRDEIQQAVSDLLESYGVENPVLGPPVDADSRGWGASGRGPGARMNAGPGFGDGSGPYGPGNGQCLR